MLFITKRYLCVIRSDIELDSVEKIKLRELLEDKPSNTVYFVLDGDRLYGMVSYGDVLKEKDGRVPINKSFISLGRAAYMEARERFRKADTICEIPVVESGRLVGEFHKFDDELMLDRARSLEYNAYAPAYFESLRNVALVRPAPSRGYKFRYFDKMRSLLERYGVAYKVVDFTDALTHPSEFSTYFMVDEQERRGMQILLDLFERRPHYLYRMVTYCGMLSKLESSEIVDYHQIFADLHRKGVEVVMLTARHNDTDYILKTEREMKKRFPIVINNLNALMKPFEEQFFDDLYCDKEYIRNIETGYFVVERDRESMRLRDTRSDFINVENGERVTIGQPEDYTRTVCFFGPCLVIGSYVGDEYTIESYLQALVNEAGYRVRVVNCGCWGGNIASISRMLSTLIREGDVVVMLLEDTEVSVEGLKSVDLWEVLEEHRVPSGWLLDMPYHANHRVTKLYAQKLFDVIFDAGYRGRFEQAGYITQSLDVIDKFFIQKYFHGYGLDGFSRVACCVFNGNPFTFGHLGLTRIAAEAMDRVYALSVKEDSSVFSFNERYAMAVDATRDMDNVVVVPSGLFIGNSANFPAYYAKVYEGNVEEQVRMHVESYASIAKLLGATHRYVGSEPDDQVANCINETCKRILPGYGIETVVVERASVADGRISGSYVRKLAANDDPALDDFVPEAIAGIIRCETANAF